MKKYFALLITSALLVSMGFAQVKVINLLCENRVNPAGMDILNPRFSWQLESDQRNLMQSGYEIRVGYKSGKNELWNSGKVLSSQSVYVPYKGSALQSTTSYYWQVRVWDNKGKTSEWSEKAFWQMGMLQSADWKAKWIESETAADTVNGPALLFRKKFTSGKKIISATAFITTHGMYEAFIT